MDLEGENPNERVVRWVSANGTLEHWERDHNAVQIVRI